MLVQQDIVEQKDYYDRVAFGGWAMDLHPADGIYSQYNSCTQWHTKVSTQSHILLLQQRH